MTAYNLAVLLNDNDMRWLIGYTDGARATMAAALSCDRRVPRAAIGYVSQLVSESASRRVQLDAARMLSRYVPFVADIPQD